MKDGYVYTVVESVIKMKKVATLTNFSTIYNICKESIKDIRFRFKDNQLTILEYVSNTTEFFLTCKVDVEHNADFILDRNYFVKFNYPDVDFFIDDNYVTVKHNTSEARLRPIDNRCGIPKKDEPFKINESIQYTEVILTTEEMKKIISLIKGEKEKKFAMYIKDGRLTVGIVLLESDYFEYKDGLDPSIDMRTVLSVDLFEEAMASYSKFEKFTLMIGNNVPLIIKFNDDLLDVRILIAPRIEGDD